jgi:hypothetical protein
MRLVGYLQEMGFLMFVAFFSLVLNLYYFFFAISFFILNKYLHCYSVLYSSYKRATPPKNVQASGPKKLRPAPGV